MFDIGASELLVIGVVALIVIGPERLPRVARTLGHLVGRMQRYVGEVKADINREIELEELRKLKSTMQDAARDIEQTVTSQVNYIESEVKQAGDEIQKQVESAAAEVKGIQMVPAAAPSNAPAAPSAELPQAANEPAASADAAKATEKSG
ncbi:MAG TPA: Sec-independent protein translocase protein TatB [Burkholderiales bacterium]|nr:Sec-independent protein translocase protein TatB [Burkholderiales bacterium]